MSRLRGPLLSLGASGRLTRALTLARRLTGPAWLLRGRPDNPRTDAQVAWRTMWQLAASLWHDLSQAEQAVWETQGTARGMTGFAWYMSQALRPNPGIYLPLAGGTMTGNIDMDGHQVTDMIDPTDPAHAARKAYVDAAIPTPMVLARAFLNTREDNFPHAKNAAVGLNDTSFDADSMFQTGVWQQGVADAGSNATTIVDADPTTGAGFEAAMRYYRVTWDAGASYGFIESVDSPTQVTIYKTTGANMAPGDTYTITKAYFLIPTAGYWLLSGTANWIWNTVVADKEYLTEFLVNGVFTSRIVAQTAALKALNPLSVDVVHLAVDDKVALGVESYAGVDTSDIYGSAAAAHTWLNILLLKAD